MNFPPLFPDDHEIARLALAWQAAYFAAFLAAGDLEPGNELTAAQRSDQAWASLQAALSLRPELASVPTPEPPPTNLPATAEIFSDGSLPPLSPIAKDRLQAFPPPPPAHPSELSPSTDQEITALAIRRQQATLASPTLGVSNWAELENLDTAFMAALASRADQVEPENE